LFDVSSMSLDLTAIRERLAGAQGAEYWRSLEEVAGHPSFEDALTREFPSCASEWTDSVGRREFLRLMGASLALAGVTACTRQPAETIVPYVRQPEEIVPGRPLFYATAATLGGFATGVLVETHMGRPTKIEGNPDHPSSLGAADVFAQAAILDLYDPDRSQTVTFEGQIRPWSAFVAAAQAALRDTRRVRGRGLYLLTERVTSPTLTSQLRSLLTELPLARWLPYEPMNFDHARRGAQLAFGEVVDPRHRLDSARVVLSIDADFLGFDPDRLRLAREFAASRRPDGAAQSRLYVVESTPSLTGANADHRLVLRPSDLERFARALAARLGVGVAPPGSTPDVARFVEAVARDLEAHRGAGVVMAGPAQPAPVHALAHVLNQTLGNAGATVVYQEPADGGAANHDAALRELVGAIEKGTVTALVIAGGNPVYTAPADLQLAERLRKVALTIRLGEYVDETSMACQWHVPQAHFLESWSDARAFDGTAAIIQPAVAPLFAGRSPHEFFAAFSSRPDRSAYDIVREHWTAWLRSQAPLESGEERAAPPPASAPSTEKTPAPPAAPPGAPAPGAQATEPEGAPTPGVAAPPPGGTAPGQPVPEGGGRPAADPVFERFWRKALHDGVIPGTASPTKPVTAAAGWLEKEPFTEPAEKGLAIVFRPDPAVFDGRFANNGWLQELPKPLTKLAWDNAALVSPRTGERLGLRQDISFQGGEHGQLLADVVELRYQGRTVRAPVLITPGQADDCVTLHLGYGRERAGRTGSGLGVNANALRTSDGPWGGVGLEIALTGERYSLASTQSHHSMEGRDIVRTTTAAAFRSDPEVLQKGHEPSPRSLSLYPQFGYEGHAWGMTIDLNACIGCNACVVACQAENNIPVVGKAQVLRGREMHWLRVDRYHRGSLDAPETFFQPVPCMHCENAPCEVVCPVGATGHSAEGLNEMVYNRCVGTRYCSNNCPYKVRRFNFLLYADWETASLKSMRNPDVSVRSRGVMEKCTYCVQRISAARSQAQQEGRSIRDGDVVTACEAACPTKAIVFGDINDPGSRVAAAKRDGRNYGLLEGLNTRPRTTYLGLVRNPNPAL
jgi:molybdopterin-containing oxidoreductase family iron-sulfur binding subunit